MLHQLSLATADLSGTELRRDFVADPAGEDEVYLQAYDRTTLWYDAFWRDGRVYLICPKLMNFLPWIKAAKFMLDGKPSKIARLRSYRRHDVIELESRWCPAEISVAGEGFEVATPVSLTELDRFAGMNAHFTLSLDNDPEWIRDFALFHRRTQDLQAMVLFDNGSTRYPLSTIEDALQDVGLKDFAIVSAPLPYGRNSASNSSRAKFLQVALMNVARLRFLGRARAVLNADIDELVWTKGATVFDKAVNSFLGVSIFAGAWRFPRQGLKPTAVHNAHDHICDKRIPCPSKYCIAPQGLLRRLSWDVHRLTGLPFKKKWLHRSDIGFLHCARVTTDWSGKMRMSKDWKLHYDSETCDLLEQAFSVQHAHNRTKLAA